jgi:hypothetical protein
VNRSLTVLLTLLIVLAFTCGPALSADRPVDKSMQAPAKIDKAKTDQSKEKVQSKDVKVQTGKNVSNKTDKAYGEGVVVPRLPPPGGPPIGGKNTKTVN